MCRSAYLFFRLQKCKVSNFNHYKKINIAVFHDYSDNHDIDGDWRDIRTYVGFIIITQA